MSDDLTAAGPAGVSPLRKKVSALILILLIGVLGIEIRAGLGQYMTGNSLAAIAPDGAFPLNTLSYDELQASISMGPESEVVRESDAEVEYRYTWFSLLRPLLSRPQAAIFVKPRSQTAVFIRQRLWAAILTIDH